MLGKRIINTGAAGAACTTDTVQILDDSPLESIATYQLDGAATSIPNNTYPGTATDITYATGKFGQAAVFNGSSSRIDASNVSNFPTGNSSRSISLWVYNQNTVTAGIIGYGNSANSQAFYLYLDGQGDLGVYGYFYNYNSNYTLPTNQWVHLVITHDGTTTRVYANGTEQFNLARTFNTGANSFRIGGVHWNNSGEYFNGKIDQVRIFDTTLDSGTITKLYNETVATASNSYINVPSGVAYYKMSDATDETGSYDGTATNVNFNVAGKFGNAGEFNGSSSGIATNITNSVIPVNSDFTISTWINTSVTSSGFIVAEGNWNAWSTAGFGIQLVSSNRIELSIANNGGGGTQVVSSSIPLNNWVHIAATIDIGNFLKLYIDGSEVASTALSNNSRNSVSGGFYIGTTNSSQYYFNGKIDQVRIFDRAITANEVETLYNEVQCIPTIVPTDYFNPVIYADTTTSVPHSVGFAPDFIWFKARNGARSHQLYDTVRGDDFALWSDLTDAQYDYSNHPNGDLSPSITSTGFTTPPVANNGINRNGETYVAWNWKSGGAAVSNTDGDITSTVSANQDAGLSIVNYNGNGTSGATIGHGLSQAPEMIIIKRLNDISHWRVGTNATGTLITGYFLTNALAVDTSAFQSFDSTTFTLGSSNDVNTPNANDNYIAYCFHSVDGYSKIGSYTGTGASGNSIVTGFRPAYVMIKSTGATSGDWNIFDNKRNTSNPLTDVLKANTSGTETTEAALNINFNSNGFTLNGASGAGGTGQINSSGITYIFLAIAEEVFNPNGVTRNATDPFGDSSELALYKFEDDATDSTGSNDGTWSGTETYGTGYIAKAAVFNGVNQTYVKLPSAVDTILNTKNFGLSFWVKAPNATTDAVFSTETTNSTFQIHANWTIAGAYALINGGGSNINLGAVDSNWHHIVVTSDGSSSYKGYFDGVYKGASAYRQTSNVGTFLGAHPGGGFNLLGEIDQVRIFNRALDSGEVTQLYNE